MPGRALRASDARDVWCGGGRDTAGLRTSARRLAAQGDVLIAAYGAVAYSLWLTHGNLFTHFPSNSLTYLLTSLLTHLPAYSLTHLRTYSLTYLFTYLLTHGPR